MAAPDIIGKASQALLALGLSTVPFWGRSLLSEDMQLSYLLREPYVYQLAVVSVALVFTPQILVGLHLGWRRLSVILFNAVWRPRRVEFPISAALTWLIVIISLSVFVGGTAQYLFSVLREIKYAEGISRGHLIEDAMARDAGPRIADAIDVIDRILREYPNAQGNNIISRWSKQVHDAADTSERLERLYDELATQSRVTAALLILHSSLEVWPENESAREKLLSNRREFIEQKDALVSLFAECQQETSQPLTLARPAWRFIPGAPIETVETDKLSAASNRALVDRLCSYPRRFANADAMLTDIVWQLFDGVTR